MFKIPLFGLSSVFYTSCTKKEPYLFIGKTHKFKNLLNLMTLGAFVFSFTLNPEDKLIILGRDYDLGDIVPVISIKYGLQVYARIAGIDFVEEGNEDTKINLILQIE